MVGDLKCFKLQNVHAKTEVFKIEIYEEIKNQKIFELSSVMHAIVINL